MSFATAIVNNSPANQLQGNGLNSS